MIRGNVEDAREQSLGVDIGTREMKLVLLSKVGGALTVEAVKVVPLPSGAVAEGSVEDRPALAGLLRDAISEAKTTSTRAVISIPTNAATLRWVNLPQLDEDEHRQAAAFKVKKHLPYPVEEAYIASTPIQAVGEDGVGESLVICVPREIISTRAFAVDRAGARPVAAELEAQALLRVLERCLRAKSALLREASMTMIDMGGSQTQMYVVQNQKLQFIRSVRFGSIRLARRIAEELNVSDDLGASMLANPEGYLDGEGLLSLPYEGQTIKVSVKAEIEILLKEIARLMRYFRSLHAERSYAGILDHMMLTGGLANLRGLATYLEEQLQVRIEPMEPFGSMTFNVPNQAFELAAQSENSFAVAVGLALSQFTEPEHEETTDGNHDFVWARGA